jgi:NAD(P)-dependent dehydrogenase (short-subunit alcohol dehydrogenase family)
MMGMAERSPFDLHGLAGMVTGGALGIGAGIAAALHRAGAAVLLVDKDLESAKTTAASIGQGSEAVQAYHADVSSPGEIEAAIEAAVTMLGSLDVLVNNAGIYPVRSLQEVTPELFETVLRTNLFGTTFACRAAARVMQSQRGRGSIINIASLEGIKPSMVGLSMYAASKGGVIAMTQHLARELAPEGIRVNAIAPGAIVTEGSARMTETSNMTEEERQEMLRGFEARIPLSRLGQPADLGGAAVFLASEASSYVTGALIPVDGGLLLS